MMMLRPLMQEEASASNTAALWAQVVPVLLCPEDGAVVSRRTFSQFLPRANAQYNVVLG